MLILTRKPGEVICIGDEVFITIVEIKGNQIRVGVDAPKGIRVFRKEIYDQIQAENKAAASVEGSLEGLHEVMNRQVVQRSPDEASGAKPASSSPLSQFTTARVQEKTPHVIKKKKREEP
jgi:carbon storage regulator